MVFLVFFFWKMNTRIFSSSDFFMFDILGIVWRIEHRCPTRTNTITFSLPEPVFMYSFPCYILYRRAAPSYLHASTGPTLLSNPVSPFHKFYLDYDVRPTKQGYGLMLRPGGIHLCRKSHVKRQWILQRVCLIDVFERKDCTREVDHTRI